MHLCSMHQLEKLEAARSAYLWLTLVTFGYLVHYDLLGCSRSQKGGKMKGWRVEVVPWDTSQHIFLMRASVESEQVSVVACRM